MMDDRVSEGCVQATAGDRLKAFRKHKQLSQRALAEKLGVSQGIIGFVENGTQPPSRNFIEKMHSQFGVSSDWLLFGRGEAEFSTASPSASPADWTSAVDNYQEPSPVGDRLREERQRLGLTVRVFAVVCEVSHPSQVRYEAGKRLPDTTYLANATRIGVDVLYVITGERMGAAPAPVLQIARPSPVAPADISSATPVPPAQAPATNTAPSLLARLLSLFRFGGRS